jgi:hypothetical protein
MKRILPALLALLAVAFTGCIQLEDTLTVNGDGSGSWKFDIALGPQMTAMIASGGSQGNNTLFKEVEFRAAVAKIKGARVVSYSVKTEPSGMKVKGEMAFQSIVEVYRSKAFDEQLNWELKKVGGNLEADIRKGMMGGSSDDRDTDLTSNMDFKSIKGLMVGMKMDRTLVLPNKVLSGNSSEKSGNRARWVVELTKDTTEAQFKKMNAERPHAVCSAAGVFFKLPLSPKDSAPIDLSEFATDDVAIKAQLD